MLRLFASQELLVKPVNLGDHLADIELAEGELAPARAHCGAQIRLGEQLRAIRGGLVEIAWLAEEAGFAVNNSLGGAIGAIGDDGNAHRQRLRDDAGQPLPQRGEQENVHCRHHARHIAAQAGEHGAVGDAFRCQRCFDIGAQRAIAHQQKVAIRQLAGYFPGNPHPIERVLLGGKAPDVAEHGRVERQAQRVACGGAVYACRVELIQWDGAADEVVLLRFADARLQALLNVGLSDDDERIREAGGEPFQQDVRPAHGGGHVLVEAPPVDGVDDDGDARKFGGDAAQDAGFGAVRVDNRVLLAAHEADEREQGARIVERRDLAQQCGEDQQRYVARTYFLDEAAFRAGLWTGKHRDAEARRIEQRGGVHGVLLRAADDQAGDGVEDGDKCGAILIYHRLAKPFRTRLGCVLLFASK